jgi:hypothetical protein
MPDELTPRQFFDEVAEPNAHLAITHRNDLRRAINAMISLDAFFGILHAALYNAGMISQKKDDIWKAELVKHNTDYELLRDAAYAQARAVGP